jgi:hypothetical protein
MTNQFTHIADVKVGAVKGNRRVYPQLRLPSHYAELAGKKASIYEISGHKGDIAFIIRFDNQNHIAAYLGDTLPEGRVADGREVPVKPCRGSDSGSNPDSGAPFLLLASMQLAPRKISDLSIVI